MHTFAPSRWGVVFCSAGPPAHAADPRHGDPDDPARAPVHERLSYWASEMFEPRTATLTAQGRRTLGEIAATSRAINLKVVIAVDYGELSAPRARVEIEVIGSQ